MLKVANNLLIENAMITETRKMQQQYYGPILGEIVKDEFAKNFESNQEFRNKFLQLMVIFLSKDNLHDKHAEHHKFIEKNILSALEKIK